MRDFFDGVYNSDEIGYAKPDRRFFEYVLRDAGVADKDCVVIGDSLSSDIEGARRAGLDACWFNAKGLVNEKKIPVRYEITELSELIGIVEG